MVGSQEHWVGLYILSSWRQNRWEMSEELKGELRNWEASTFKGKLKSDWNWGRKLRLPGLVQVRLISRIGNFESCFLRESAPKKFIDFIRGRRGIVKFLLNVGDFARVKAGKGVWSRIRNRESDKILPPFYVLLPPSALQASCQLVKWVSIKKSTAPEVLDEMEKKIRVFEFICERTKLVIQKSLVIQNARCMAHFCCFSGSLMLFVI